MLQRADHNVGATFITCFSPFVINPTQSCAAAVNKSDLSISLGADVNALIRLCLHSEELPPRAEQPRVCLLDESSQCTVSAAVQPHKPSAVDLA